MILSYEARFSDRVIIGQPIKLNDSILGLDGESINVRNQPLIAVREATWEDLIEYLTLSGGKVMKTTLAKRNNPNWKFVEVITD